MKKNKTILALSFICLVSCVTICAHNIFKGKSNSNVEGGNIYANNNYEGVNHINVTEYNTITSELEAIKTRIDHQNNLVNLVTAEKEKLKQEQQALDLELDKKKVTIKIDTNDNKIDSSEFIKNRRELVQKRIKEINKLLSINDSSYQYSKLQINNLNIQNETLKKQLESQRLNLQKKAQTLEGEMTVDFKGVTYNLFIADADSNAIRMHWRNKSNKNYYSIGSLISGLRAENLDPLMVTNAGMYTQNCEPQGLFIQGYKNELRKLDTTAPITDANFYLKPNGVYFIDTAGYSHISTTQEFYRQYNSKAIAVRYATQSGPMLLIDGEIHRSFAKGSFNKKIRSGVGIVNEKKTVFILSQTEANFYDFALLMKDVFGCKQALFLDGAISEMYLKHIDSTSLGGHFGPMISITNK